MSGLLVFTLIAGVMVSADWPQFLGPARNGVYGGPPLADMWPPAGPRVVWRKSIGQGFSAPVVTGDRVLLFHRVDGNEVLDALEAQTGNPLWRYQYPTRYKDDFGFDEGPRAAPVVADGLVFTYGAEGQLHAVNVSSGQRVWSEDALARFRVPKGFFGAAGSPLVEDGRVMANVGGKDGGRDAGIVAFDAKTGKILWTATGDQASYSSGVSASLGGARRAIFLTRNALVGLDPTSGAVVFRRGWQSRSAASVNAATPLVIGDLIFISAEYGPGAGVLRVEGSKLVELWTSNDALSNHYATSVHLDGVLYGFHGRQELGPSLRAVDLRTGKVRWSEDGFRAGTVTLAGDRLLIIRETGEMLLAPASPAGFKPVARARVLPGVVRAYPALSDGFVYVRNDNTLVCLDLRR